jgi:hypothetical protein
MCGHRQSDANAVSTDSDAITIAIANPNSDNSSADGNSTFANN